jgi:hypothetical protein
VIVKEIAFNVSRIRAFQGLVICEGNQRIVRIYLGVPFVFHMLSQAMLVGVKENRACHEEYISELLSTILYNSNPGLPPEVAPEFCTGR